MTKDELRRLPASIISKRKLVVGFEGKKHEETYYLLKKDNIKYYVSFSEDGSSLSQMITEDFMIKAINDEELSSNVALDIFAQDVHLYCMID